MLPDRSLDSAPAQFRKLIAQKTVVMPGVFNAITARIAERAGFDALYLSGAGVTNALTGFPDIGLLTLTELAAQASYVTRAANLPVICDADTGFGGFANATRTVAEFEQAGAAGIHLEDQVFPKRCGHLDGKQVVSPVEMAIKLRAAVDARRNPQFMIIARTDARNVNGIDDAIERAKRYVDAGADAIFPEALQGAAEFEQFASAIDVPLLANMTEFGKTPLITAAEFASLGYAMVIFPMTAFRVMMHAAEHAYAELKAAGTQAALLDSMQTRQELYDLIDYDSYKLMDSELADG